MIQQATQIQSILLEAAFTKAIQDKIANHKASAKDPGYRELVTLSLSRISWILWRN
jgi:hypothetical protein